MLICIPHLISTLNNAIEEQTCIGWSAAMKGFLSRQWFHLTSANLLNHDKFELKAGRHRTQKALHALQDFTRDIWLGRNDALHKDKETVDTIVYSAESAEIRHFHSNPKLLPASDAHYCTTVTLNRIIQSRPSVRRRWLRRVRTARANFLKDGNLQQSIRTYLNPATQKQDTQPVRLQPVHSTAHPRSTTTQQRMTSFFPGRPPDLLPTNPSPGNPSLPQWGRWGWVPSAILRTFSQKVNLYNLFYNQSCSYKMICSPRIQGFLSWVERLHALHSVAVQYTGWYNPVHQYSSTP